MVYTALSIVASNRSVRDSTFTHSMLKNDVNRPFSTRNIIAVFPWVSGGPIVRGPLVRGSDSPGYYCSIPCTFHIIIKTMMKLHLKILPINIKTEHIEYSNYCICAVSSRRTKTDLG